MPEATDPASVYSRETDRLASAARWLAAGLAGFGAVLVAGMDLTRFGRTWDHGGTQAVVVFAALVVGSAAFGWMIAVTATVFTSGALSLEAMIVERFDDSMPDRLRKQGWREGPARIGDLIRGRSRRRQVAERRTVRADIDREAAALYADVATSLGGLHQLLQDAATEHRQAIAGREVPSAEVIQRLTTARTTGALVTDYANYSLALLHFRRTKRHLVGGSIAALAAVVCFAMAVYH